MAGQGRRRRRRQWRGLMYISLGMSIYRNLAIGKLNVNRTNERIRPPPISGWRRFGKLLSDRRVCLWFICGWWWWWKVYKGRLRSRNMTFYEVFSVMLYGAFYWRFEMKLLNLFLFLNKGRGAFYIVCRWWLMSVGVRSSHENVMHWFNSRVTITIPSAVQ